MTINTHWFAPPHIIPLVEIVGRPDIRLSEQAKAYVAELRKILLEANRARTTQGRIAALGLTADAVAEAASAGCCSAAGRWGPRAFCRPPRLRALRG